MNLSPIAVFTYRRLEQLKKTVAALQKNQLASESHLYIFSDAAKSVAEEQDVQKVRQFIKSISGFKSICINEADKNIGLANSIIGGVNNVLLKHGKVIVLEDDLVTSSNFLLFMNQALEFYRDNNKILSISGFTLPMKDTATNSVYFTRRISSWGWATWKNRWENIDWDVSDYREFNKNNSARSRFNEMGSDLCRLLDRQQKGKINSWAIRLSYHQFKKDLHTVYPAVSKVQNIGFSDDMATHTKDKYNRFKTILDVTERECFSFLPESKIDKKLLKQFLRPYSIPQRIRYKILNSFF